MEKIIQSPEHVLKLSKSSFQQEYLLANKPVTTNGEMQNWKAMSIWTPKFFVDSFGDQQVQLYGNLFELMGIISFKEYINKYFGNKLNKGIIPYVRWYTKLKDCDFEWSDDFFHKIREYWLMPSFLPEDNYLLPFFNLNKIVNPVHDNFPAKAIFISAQGAKTSLHVDPWSSDAILCQIYGTKKVILYSPDQGKYLMNDGKCVDTDNPDIQAFPDFHKAVPTYVKILKPGEMIFLPNGWFHKVDTLSDSISLTWNFVHITTWKAFFKYIIKNTNNDKELEVIKYFLN